jgi:hypothetical protein
MKYNNYDIPTAYQDILWQTGVWKYEVKINCTVCNTKTLAHCIRNYGITHEHNYATVCLKHCSNIFKYPGNFKVPLQERQEQRLYTLNWLIKRLVSYLQDQEAWSHHIPSLPHGKHFQGALVQFVNEWNASQSSQVWKWNYNNYILCKLHNHIIIVIPTFTWIYYSKFKVKCQ